MSSIAVSFKQRYPGVVPSIHVENSQWILNEVLVFRLDIGIVGVKPKQKDLIVFPFLDEELVILVPANHPWAKRKTVMLKELQDKPLILREKGSGTRGLIESEFNAAGIRPAVAMEIGSKLLNGQLRIIWDWPFFRLQLSTRRSGMDFFGSYGLTELGWPYLSMSFITKPSGHLH